MAEIEQNVSRRNDAYTGFLAISFLAMVGGTVLLYLEFDKYEGKTPPKAPVIDVPGIQLKTLTGTGGPTPPKVEPKVVEPPPEPEPKTMNRVPPAPVKETLVVQPILSAPLPDQPVSAFIPSKEPPPIDIPELPALVLEPVQFKEPVQANEPLKLKEPPPVVVYPSASLDDSPLLPPPPRR